MRNNNFSGGLVLAIVVAAVIISGVLHPSFFISGNAATTAAGTTPPGSNQVPILVLPSLSADIGAQTQAPSSGAAVAANSTPVSIAAPGVVPNVGSEVELIADLTTGEQYAGKNVSERWPMASISKLMTAVIAINVLDPNQHITITQSMAAVDPDQHILNIGDTYTVEDLLHVMLLPSNNVAAEALAQSYGRANFLAAMNTQAQTWGMTSTYYDDPSGLSAANESSAVDLLKLAQHIYATYPQILAITRMPVVTVQNISTGLPVTIKSINNFAGTPEFVGGKTGYTDQADGNLLSIFQYDNRPIFIVVLGIDDGVRFNATQDLYTWFKANFK